MDVLTLPSYREGFGMVVAEAEAMGVPVVVSDVPGPIDAMEPDVTGLIVKVKDWAALEKALYDILTDAKKRFAYGQNAAKFAAEKFDRKIFLGKVYQDKERLLSDFYSKDV